MPLVLFSVLGKTQCLFEITSLSTDPNSSFDVEFTSLIFSLKKKIVFDYTKRSRKFKFLITFKNWFNRSVSRSLV